MTLRQNYVERVPTRLGLLSVRTIGAGRTTVLWPSMFVDGTTWHSILPLLQNGSALPRRFVVVDPPGLGLSEPLSRITSITEAAGAARDLLDGLAIDGPVDWVGNAFGGHVGYELADDPAIVRSLVTISAPAEPIPPALRRKIRALHPLLRLAGPVGPIPGAVIGAMLTDASAADPEIRRVVLDALRRPSRSSLARALQSFILDRVDVTDRLRDIRVPSLYVASDDRGDWSPTDAQRAAELTPNATAVTITEARTLVPLEQPERLAEAILAFWAGPST